MLARVQEQLTSHWEGNQALASGIRAQLAQHEASLMDLREALNQAVGTTREAEELNSHNQERLEEALVRGPSQPPSPLSPPSPLPLLLPTFSLPACPLPSSACGPTTWHASGLLSLTPHSPSPLATEAGAIQG